MKRTNLKTLSLLSISFCIAFGASSLQAQQKSTKTQKDDKKAKAQIQAGTQNIGRLISSSRTSKDVVATLEPIASSAAASTVSVLSGRKQVALGTVVDSEGYILTKASQLDKNLKVVFGEETYAAKVFGVDSKTDLALLKIEAENLTAAQLVADPPPILGSWLALAGPNEAPFSVGIVAVESRRISGSRAFVGIGPTDIDDRDGVLITQITPDSPAEAADIRVDDVIVKIADADTPNVVRLRATLAKFEPGDTVDIMIERGKGKDMEKVKVTLELAPLNTFFPQFQQRTNQQNRMGSSLSQRRSNFPLVFQTDASLNANQCGGPIVDLSGNIVGISIARAERVSSLVLPIQTVLPVIESLKTGDFSPMVVNKKQIDNIEEQITSLQEKLEGLPEKEALLNQSTKMGDAKKEVLEKSLEQMQAQVDGLNKSIKEFQSELDEIDKAEARTELKSLRSEISSFKRRIKKLQREKEELENGFGG